MKKVLLLALTILTIGCSKDEKTMQIMDVANGEFIHNNQGTFTPVSSVTTWYDQGGPYVENAKLNGFLTIGVATINWSYTTTYEEDETYPDSGAASISNLKDRLLVSNDINVLVNNKVKLKVQYEDGDSDGIVTLTRSGNLITYEARYFYNGDLESESILIVKKS